MIKKTTYFMGKNGFIIFEIFLNYHLWTYSCGWTNRKAFYPNSRCDIERAFRTLTALEIVDPASIIYFRNKESLDVTLGLYGGCVFF